MKVKNVTVISLTKSTDIVKKRLVKTVKYRGKNSNPNVASFKKRSNKPVIYKYDPKDYNGLPLVINTCGSPLIVYDPSFNYNYEITQDNNGYNISTYQYDGDKLFSNSRSAPVMIWNTGDKKYLNRILPTKIRTIKTVIVVVL